MADANWRISYLQNDTPQTTEEFTNLKFSILEDILGISDKHNQRCEEKTKAIKHQHLKKDRQKRLEMKRKRKTKITNAGEENFRRR